MKSRASDRRREALAAINDCTTLSDTAPLAVLETLQRREQGIGRAKAMRERVEMTGGAVSADSIGGLAALMREQRDKAFADGADLRSALKNARAELDDVRAKHRAVSEDRDMWHELAARQSEDTTRAVNERDAVIRERDEARAECERLRALVVPASALVEHDAAVSKRAGELVPGVTRLRTTYGMWGTYDGTKHATADAYAVRWDDGIVGHLTIGVALQRVDTARTHAADDPRKAPAAGAATLTVAQCMDLRRVWERTYGVEESIRALVAAYEKMRPPRVVTRAEVERIAAAATDSWTRLTSTTWRHAVHMIAIEFGLRVEGSE